MEKNSTFIVLAIACVLSLIFGIVGMKTAVFFSVWSGIAGMIVIHYANNKKLKPARVY